MTRPAFYNEIDAFCCDVLRARIADGSLPDGVVDPRDVRTINPAELTDYGQVHLFAGIGGGALACRLAGVPDDFRIITAGVPCQPASQAGKRLGAADERWLWPEFFRVLRGLRSHYALVEQPAGIVSLNDGAEWGDILGTLAEIREDLEVSRVSAADVGAPQERERLWIVAYPDGRGEEPGAAPRVNRRRSSILGERRELQSHSSDGRHCVGDSDRGRCEQHHARLGNGGELGARLGGGCEVVGNASGAGREERDAATVADDARHAAGECSGVGESRRPSIQHRHDARGSCGERREDASEGLQRERGGRDARDYGEFLRPWADAVPVRGADGTVRLIPREAAETGPQSSLWPVADGLPGRVARLRAIGNAWCPQAAAVALRVILEHAARECAA